MNIITATITTINTTATTTNTNTTTNNNNNKTCADKLTNCKSNSYIIVDYFRNKKANYIIQYKHKFQTTIQNS
ncbi:unnamed protein product [Schistosoma margrebowiei]|uniref:Uncharacterized protein n=1 Tax=Schistosoma margrebowiei TaxID=48269 RepID=A0A183LTH9_9TREM|nr:unnamed protein product [Schistosoma margrebowiei]